METWHDLAMRSMDRMIEEKLPQRLMGIKPVNTTSASTSASAEDIVNFINDTMTKMQEVIKELPKPLNSIQRKLKAYQKNKR